MTSIVNFEERIKSTGRFSDIIFDSVERLHDAKLSGVLKDDELSKIVTLEGRLFSNLVSRGLRTEADVEKFEKELPNGKYDCFIHRHRDLGVATQTIKQDNTAALYERENRFKQSQPVKRI